MSKSLISLGFISFILIACSYFGDPTLVKNSAQNL